ncbi:MAG: hypothetical protein J6B89_04175 [Bacilli bacterium]|nr:hypothetical protein [Bacilli bacterium]
MNEQNNNSNNLTSTSSTLDNDSNTSLGYSIPGAIIPNQTTDGGNVIQTVSSAAVAPSATVTSSQVGSQVGVGQIKTETVLGEQNLTQINSAVALDSVSNQSLNQINNINTSDISVSKKESRRNKKRRKKQEKKNNGEGGGATAVTGFLFFLVLVLGFLLGYFIYNDYFKEKEIIDPVKEWQKKRVVNVDSLVVKELYSYVDLYGCDEQINFFYDDSRTTVNVSDLSFDQKNYLAYNQLKHSSLDKKSCSTYSFALHKNDSEGVWYCGDEYVSSNTTNNYNDERALAYVISGDKIKEMVEKIFGPTSYKAATFKIGSSSRYLYDSKTDSYVFQSYYGGSSCAGYKNQLSSASQEGDIITITVIVTNKLSNAMMKYNYNFKETSNGNYYFVSLNKTAV